MEQRAVCGECRADLTAAKGWRPGPVVHCSGPRPSAKDAQPHHGRRRWLCPFCRRIIGCTSCAGRKAEQVFCASCEVYIAGLRTMHFTAEELRLLIALAVHATPARAIPITRLAAELGIEDNQASAVIEDLKQKGVAIGKVGDPPRVWLDSGVVDDRFDPPRPVGIELSLPLSDRGGGQNLQEATAVDRAPTHVRKAAKMG